MTRLRVPSFVAVISVLLLGACATRPINPPITQVDPRTGYRFETRLAQCKNTQDNLVILAFSGGGTRAAAFSYGVLEFLRRTEVVAPNGAKARLLDAVDVITGVSGGSFTALAYGLYGDKLFADYEQRFLKRDVQGEIIARAFSPKLLGRPVFDRLGPFRTGGPAVRRDPVQRRDLRRSQSRHRPLHHRVGHRPVDRQPLGLHPERIRRASARIWRRAVVPRRRGIVCRARRALPRHDQQLWRHLQLRSFRPGPDGTSTPRTRRDRPRARSVG